jgi:hypothetical protein
MSRSGVKSGQQHERHGGDACDQRAWPRHA